MPLDNTGIIIGERQSALIVSPASAYVVCAQCVFGCPPVFWVAGSAWIDSPDAATIFRSYEAGEAGKSAAVAAVTDCLAVEGATFDVKSLAGFVK